MNKSLALALSALLLAAATAVAQEWPTKTVRIIVPFGPGSTPDMVGRLIGDRMQQKLGQPFVIENRPGASANTGTDMVAKADPDGYTVGISLGGPLAINTLLFARMPYDPVKDIALITMLTTQPSVLVVQRSLKVDSVAELVELLRKNPGKYNYGSIGNGSLSHLAMEALALKSGTTMVHVPYAEWFACRRSRRCRTLRPGKSKFWPFRWAGALPSWPACRRSRRRASTSRRTPGTA